MTLRPMNCLHVRLDDDAFCAAVLIACRELIAVGKYPSYKLLRTKGICGASSRIIRARDAILPELGYTLPSPKARAGLAHRIYIMGLQRKPKSEIKSKPEEDPSNSEGPCWRERRMFWGTEAGKRTRALLERVPQSQPTEVQS
jgi:hypothetical protein